MGYEQQIIDNSNAIKAITDNAKNIGALNPLSTQVNLTDEIAIYKPSTGETLKTTISQLTDSGVASSSISKDILLSFTADKVTKGDVHNIFGGLFTSVTAQPLSSGVPITGTHGRSKLMVVINAGTDFSGTLTVTGTKIDRETGLPTASFSEDIIVDSLSTDASANDGLGNNVHDFTNCYITSEWFSDGYTISTTDLNLSDVDVYGIAFNQFDGAENLVINTLDLTASVNNDLAEFSGHAYEVNVVGNKVSVTSFADMEDPTSNVNVGFYRYRNGNISKSIDTSTDGIFVDMNFMPFVQSYYEAISFNLWATTTQAINVIVDGSLGLDSITYGESLQIGDLVYLKSDGKYWKADNTSEATSTTELRLILEAGVLDDVKIALAKGQYVGTGFTAGKEYVGTNGAVTSSRPTLATEVARIVSTSINATTRYFDPSKTWISGDASKINGVTIVGASNDVIDNIHTILNSLDQTKKLQFDLSNITSGTTVTVQPPTINGKLALVSDIINNGLYLGYFPLLTDLTSAYPIGDIGQYAIVGATDTVWIWDDNITQWVDSGNEPIYTAINSVGVSELKAPFKTVIDLGDVSGIVDLDWSLAVKYKLNMIGNTTLTFSNVTNYIAVKTQLLELTSNSDAYTLIQPTGVNEARDLTEIDLTLTNYFTYFPHATNIYQSSVIAGNVGGILDFLYESSINTLAKINAIITDAILIDTEDSRLSDTRTPTNDTVTLAKVADEQKARVVLSTANIDWSLGKEFTKTLTAAWTITETNLPTGTDTDIIEVNVTGAFAIIPPAYWVKYGTNNYDGAKKNIYVINCLNGTGASEEVSYAILTEV